MSLVLVVLGLRKTKEKVTKGRKDWAESQGRVVYRLTPGYGVEQGRTTRLTRRATLGREKVVRRRRKGRQGARLGTDATRRGANVGILSSIAVKLSLKQKVLIFGEGVLSLLSSLAASGTSGGC